MVIFSSLKGIVRRGLRKMPAFLAMDFGLVKRIRHLARRELQPDIDQIGQTTVF